MSIHLRFCLKGATPLIFVISTWFLEVLIFFAKQHVDVITDHDIFLEADFNYLSYALNLAKHINKNHEWKIITADNAKY